MCNNSNTDQTPLKFCWRCCLPVDMDNSINIEGMHFHRACYQCYICRTVPKCPTFYFGQMFCEHCFARYSQFGPGGVPNGPTDFFRQCFENLRDPKVQESFISFMHSGCCGTPIVHIHPCRGQCCHCANTSKEE